MKLRFMPGFLFACVVLPALPSHAQSGKSATVWLSTEDRSSLLAPQPAPLQFTKSDQQAPAIEVNDQQKYQTMDGFGFALTGGSAQLLMRMDAPRRKALLQELFGTGDRDISVSYLRISIGSSDMNDHAFTYDDLKPGETDPGLKKFDFGPDKTSVIPVLKEIIAINPRIKILGSPWSAPAWMKTNGNLKGGNLKPEYYDTYAQYFVKFIVGMKAAGIRIDAVTPQNEPLNPKNTPSMVVEPTDEAALIAKSLGPAFRKAGIETRIIVFDHNCDRPDYPLTILNDPEARQYVEGAGFHLYEGEITALTKVHEAYPQKNLYFTEQMVVDERGDPRLHIAAPVAGLIVGAPRNWSRNVLLWNLAADPEFKPHTNDGGCPVCEGAITLDGNKVTRNLAYYTVAHAAKFVPPSSVRIQSSMPDKLPNVAYETPGGKYVVIVANTSGAAQTFQIRFHGESVVSTLSGGAVATYVW
jgi:glucosylceramidase